ncbi:uncharacterized protein cfap97d2 [Engraulis encrasicolus]|uniref:uncharacterized protein cfap97d2 n=1 Tax=Engraulis encrasicolus TaxID=184585 RepID=UPI002FD1F310
MAHQSYQPVVPCVSKLLQHRWDQSNYDIHRKKVSSAKATINRTPPKTYPHINNNSKEKRLKEDRISVIERDNHILLEKISHIMRTTGRIDNKNDYITKRLSSEKRQQDLLRITEENLLILSRLSQCGPNYSVQRWHDDWLRTTALMENIGRYPRLTSVQAQRFGAWSAKKVSGGQVDKSTAEQEQSSDSTDGKHPGHTQPEEDDDSDISPEEKNADHQDQKNAEVSEN